MYLWEKSQKRIQILALVFLILSPIAIIAGYGMKVASIVSNLVEKPLAYEPDPSEFVDINYTRLAEMVEWTDKRFETHHIALNMSVDTIFTDESFETIEEYRFTDNQALRGGFAITSYAFKYLAGKRENNLTLQNDALRVLRNLTDGFAMFLRIPNGGLGPEYAGILARGFSPPDPEGIGSFYFQDHPKEANGTGIYSDWRWRGFTSNDEHSGFYIALAVLLKYVDDPFITNLTHLMIEQIANYLVQTNFIGFQQYGGPSGIEQKPRALQSGFWVACVLKMASIVNPTKYEPIYFHWLSSEGVVISGDMSGSLNLIMDYFAFLLDYGPVFSFLILEDAETPQWQQLYRSYLESIWANVHNNRNAYFNALHLAILAEAGQASRGDYPILEYDLEDQLMRLDINHFPERFDPKPSMPSDIPPSQEWIDIHSYLTENPVGQNLAFVFADIDYDEVWYDEPLSVEYRPAHTFLWEISPLTQEARYEDSLCETAGLTLSTPYWIARASGYILPEGVKVNDFYL